MQKQYAGSFSLPLKPTKTNVSSEKTINNSERIFYNCIQGNTKDTSSNGAERYEM